MILAIDSSAVSASVALTDKESVIKSEFVNTGLTHSETLMPMIKRVADGVDLSALDAIAVTVGPGSFTGVRIGVATVKGLAFANNIPCIGVSTLEAIAYNFSDKNCTVCAVMDARRMQFYNAVFNIKDGVVTRLCDDRAIDTNDLRKDISKYENVIIAGDGARLCFDNINLNNVLLADDAHIFQNAVSVGMCAKNKEKISHSALVPVYLRQSQAERELKLKLKK